MKAIKEIDTRGLACPMPVVKTKKALEEEGAVELYVLTDSETSRDNVMRFATSTGCAAEYAGTESGEYRVVIVKGKDLPAVESEISIHPQPRPTAAGAWTVVYIDKDRMGHGSDELGRKLMGGFIKTWMDMDPPPWRMLFVNGGVHITTEGSDLLEFLGILEDKGVEILSCGTCLEHFELTEKLGIGRVTNMYEIIETLNAAEKVISP